MDTETLNEIAVEVVEAGTRDFYSQINSSVLLLLSIAIVWFFFSFVVFRRSGVSATERRRVRSAVRAVVALSLIVGLLYVWAPELRTFALSIVAFAVAIVIATKELILCFMGGIYRLTTGASKIGDTVHVGAMRGQIVDQTLLAMTLQELGPEDNPGTFTGRRMVIPNSVLLSSPSAWDQTSPPSVCGT
ncbi:MAG: mechanosensitive ion channel domain-containing protein [Alphaproteobacteria bacterium]